MLTPDEAQAKTRELRAIRREEMPEWDEIHGFLNGRLGRPSVPAGANGEIHELSRLAIKNIMPLIVDTFTSALSLEGFRSPDEDADAAAWAIWQRERMDARQSEIHRPGVSYGASYCILVRDGDGPVHFRLRSPRQVVAVYDDPTFDEWPEYALETWVTGTGTRTRCYGVLYDETHAYPVTVYGNSASSRVEVGVGELHGFDVCPVVRFLNDRDPDDKVRGEVRPIIPDQRGINAVNFDRLVVSRFGAFPQKYVMGWTPETSEDDDGTAEVQSLSARRILTFDDPDVKAGAFPSANVTAYNEILSEMIVHAALKARVNVIALTGSVSNVGAETIALIDAPNQRKIAAKQRSFGESWEQVLRLAAKAEGVDVPENAEVLWADTEARSFAQVVDGISKLVVAGVPIASLIEQIPSLSQREVDSIVDALRRNEALDVAKSLVDAARAPQVAPEPVTLA